MLFGNPINRGGDESRTYDRLDSIYVYSGWNLVFLDQNISYYLLLVVQEVLANEKAQGSRPVNEEVDLDDLMDVSALQCALSFICFSSVSMGY